MNKQRIKKQNLAYKCREHTDDFRRGGSGAEGKMGPEEWEKQASSYGMKSHRDERYSTGNIVTGRVIQLYGD